MLQDSLSQILDEIKTELFKNGLFVKSNPDSPDIEKVTGFVHGDIIDDIFNESPNKVRDHAGIITSGHYNERVL